MTSLLGPRNQLQRATGLALIFLLLPAMALAQMARRRAFDPVPASGGGGGNDLLTGLTASWLMEEGDGATRTDASGNGFHLSNNGNVVQDLTHIQGSFSAAPSTTSSRLFSTASTLTNTTGKFTIRLLFRETADISASVVFFASRWGNDFAFLIYNNGNHIEFVTRKIDGSGNTAPAVSAVDVTTTANKWHQIVAGFDPDNSVNFVQVDGESRQTGANTQGAMRTVAEPFCLFDVSTGGTGNANVKLDEVDLWIGRVLTPAKVTTLINGFDFSAQTGTLLFFPDFH